ncbi:synaptophysin-like protein 2 [Rhynchophorus ferrugineus]|uniref:MARVEL domain-containing protein n=1 Tax=Rhynchophorus ferrugineus TaxID=354439 RepID=A0A834J076_RHYFE|nr:hypothetical protein GWI33_003350 [Rhynchophorus ferrugineus]
MDFNLSVFKEPRGVMRILHLVFSICAFATIVDYTGIVTFNFEDKHVNFEYSYPFSVIFSENLTGCYISISNDFSSDAKFFVATGVLSLLYSLFIIFVYAKMDEIYKTNKNYPLYDFLITVFLAVLWISSSAAWANGLTGLKSATSYPILNPEKCCKVIASGYSTLNISVILGFLNFIIWAADLWFLYKETAWFQGAQSSNNGEV